MPNQKAARWLDGFIILLVGVLSSLALVDAAQRLGATCDEPFYIRSGLHYWRTGDLGPLLSKGTMPLPVQICTFPVWLAEQSRAAPFTTWLDLDEILPIARSGTLLFWWLLLFYGWRIARALGGVWAGRVAVLFLAVEPNLLAHAALATTDVAITACTLAFVYHYWRGRTRGWLQRIGVPGLLYGIALLAKASALAFIPICMLLIEAQRQWSLARADGRSPWRIHWLRRWMMETLGIGCLGLGMVLICCGSNWEMEASFWEWTQTLPSGRLQASMNWLAEHLRIFPNAFNALAYQIKHNFKGHGVYLLGEMSPRAIWYYFPVALLIKLPTAVLLGVGLLTLFRPKGWASWLGVCVAGLLLFSLNCRVQIGIRLILPLLSLLIICLAINIGQLFERRPPLPFLLRCSLGLLSLLGWSWTLSETIRVWPHAIQYINEYWGGPTAGYRYLSDSNYDWGQGVPELAIWQQQHKIDVVDVWYFGTDPRLLKLPMRIAQVHQWEIDGVDSFRAAMRGRVLAVGATVLYGSYIRSPEILQVLDYLRTRTPLDRTSTFWIYDFTEGGLAEVAAVK